MELEREVDSESLEQLGYRGGEGDIGPLPVESLRPELERDPGGDVTLRRILDTVVDGYELGGDGWLELTKHVEQESDS